VSSVSLCMIVRNEAQCLAECLQSVLGAVDEMIIVDTGSTDETVLVAKHFGARVASFPWQDDFAAARNASLAHARADWIFVLDADERLVQDHGPRLRALLHGPAEVVAYLIQQRTPTPSSVANGMVRVEWLPRLFRNRPNIRYTGAVHECILPSVTGNGRVVATDVLVAHDGYLRSPDALREKATRNHRILTRELERDPADALAWIQIGDCHACLQDADAAIPAYRAGLQLLDAPSAVGRQTVAPSTAAVAWQQLAAALLIRGEVPEAVSALNRALRLWPTLASARVYLGQALARLGDWAQAIEQYRQAIDASDGPAPLDQPVHLAPWFAWYLKGAAEAKLGRTDEAERSLSEATRRNPLCADAHTLLGLLRQLREAAPPSPDRSLPAMGGRRR
jgi:tetratricopeptide (TPR) repeat protein